MQNRNQVEKTSQKYISLFFIFSYNLLISIFKELLVYEQAFQEHRKSLVDALVLSCINVYYVILSVQWFSVGLQ